MWSVFSNDFSNVSCTPQSGPAGAQVHVRVDFEFNPTVPDLNRVSDWWGLVWVGAEPSLDADPEGGQAENVKQARVPVTVTQQSDQTWSAELDVTLPTTPGHYTLLVGWDDIDAANPGLFLKVGHFKVV